MPEAREIGGAADHQPLLGLLHQSLQQHRQHCRDRAPVLLLEGLREILHELRHVREPPPHHAAVQPRPQVRQRGLAERRRAVHHALLDPAGVRDQYQHQPGRRQRQQLHVPHRGPGQRRVLHDGDLPGQLRQQPYRTAHDVVQVDGAVQEVLDGAPLGAGKRLDAGQLVDEEAVALVRRDAPGARVRLGDEALVLQRGHVVADRGGGDTELVPLGQRLGADRLLGPDIVLDDGAQHFESAFTEHRAHLQSGRVTGARPGSSGSSSLALIRSECQTLTKCTAGPHGQGKGGGTGVVPRAPATCVPRAAAGTRNPPVRRATLSRYG